MPNYCPECGEKVQEGANFCDTCGTELQSGAQSYGSGSLLKRAIASVTGLVVIATGLSSIMDIELALVLGSGIVFVVMYWYYYQIGKAEQTAKQNAN